MIPLYANFGLFMFREAFKEIKKRHGITGKAISETTGISQNHISEFVNNKRDVTSETLWRMVEALDKLSPGAWKDFCLRIAGESIVQAELLEHGEQPEDWRGLISRATPTDVEEILLAMAERWGQIKSQKRSKEPEKESIALSA